MVREKQKEVTYTTEELRAFETEIAEIFQQGKIRGPVHLSHGNEDYLIELFQYINPNDWVFSTWRNHYHALLHGVPKEYLRERILAGHSISFQAPDNHFFTSAIVNGIIPIAVGTALGLKWKNDEGCKKRDERREKGYLADFWRDSRMVWCFVGDMAASSGVFYEAVKYSVLNKLPIHFVIENNSLSTNTPSAKSWGLDDDWGVRSIFAGIDWLSADEYNQYISYFEYKRTIYPHQGTGVWVNF